MLIIAGTLKKVLQEAAKPILTTFLSQDGLRRAVATV